MFVGFCSNDYEGFSVLSTKDLVRLEQEEPYGRIEIMIK